MDTFAKYFILNNLLYYTDFASGVAPGIFRRGADSSDKGAKIWLSDGGLACSDGGYSPLALPWRHPCFAFQRLVYGISINL